MELIRKLGTRLNKSGYLESWALFWCDFCKQEVERPLCYKKCQSCGCVKIELSSKSRKGQKRTEEQRKRYSESHKGQKAWNKGLKGWNNGVNNPFYGKKHTEETRQKQADAKKGIKQTEATIEKRRIKTKGKKRTEETRQKISLANKGNPPWNKGLRGVQSGPKAPNWQGGISFEPYAPEFNKEFKQIILERDNYTCQDPNCIIENPKRLSVHHIDYNKKNNNPENLIILCEFCHCKTNGKNKRQYFTEFYQNIMMGKLMECLL